MSFNVEKQNSARGRAVRFAFAVLMAAVMALSLSPRLRAAVPQVISYQCRIATGGVNFTGLGQFKFGLVDGSGTTTFWSNDGSSSGGSQPIQSVPLAVANGMCSVLLGDTSLTNMTAIPVGVFLNTDVRVRVWFNDGSRGWQQIAPDERIAPVGYALMADTALTVPDGSLTANKLASGAVLSALNSDGSAGVTSGGIVFSLAEDPSLAAAGYVNIGTTSLRDSIDAYVWKSAGTPTSGTSPSPRSGHTAVWTGTGGSMVVWGGNNDGIWSADGGGYNSAINSWAVTNSIGTPSARVFHSAVWTGSEMIIWGGQDRNVNCFLPTQSYHYNPVSDKWTWPPVPNPNPDPNLDPNAPQGRTYHSAVWTGLQGSQTGEMIIWGGIGGGSGASATATVASGTVTAVTVTNAGCGYTAAPIVVFSGGGGSGAAATTMIASGTVTGVTLINGGSGYTSTPSVSFSAPSLGSGGRYNPSNKTWIPIPNNGAPIPRRAHTAVWTGTEMIIWGGFNPPNWLNDGARYNPATGTWTALAAAGAPAARSGHSAVWTGSEMIVWGGEDGNNHFTDLTRYNPSTNTWAAGTSFNAPVGRTYHSTVWNNTEMIVWGGLGDQGFLNDGGRYNPVTNTWTAIAGFNAPAARWAHSAVWTGTAMIIWGGAGYNGYLNDTWSLSPVTTMCIYQKM